jgi:hypothetical protein
MCPTINRACKRWQFLGFMRLDGASQRESFADALGFLLALGALAACCHGAITHSE